MIRSVSRLSRYSGGVLAQVAISLSSFINSLFAAKVLDVGAFGLFATGLAVAALLSSLFRSVTTDAWLTVGGSQTMPDIRMFQRDVNTHTVIASLLVLSPLGVLPFFELDSIILLILLSCLMAVVGTWSDSRIWLVLEQGRQRTAVRATFVGLFIQICLLGITTGEPSLVNSPVGFLILLAVGHFVTGSLATGAWGMNSLFASHRHFLISFTSTRYLLFESLLSAGSSQMAAVIVALVANVEQVGALRAASLLLAPVALVTQSLPRLMVIRYRRKSTSEREMVRNGGQLFISILLYGLAISWIPVETLQELLGASASSAKLAVFPLSIYSACVLMLVPVWANMRSTGMFQQLFRLRLLAAVPVLILPPVMAKLCSGQSGAAVGMGIAGCLTSAIWLFASRRNLFVKHS